MMDFGFSALPGREMSALVLRLTRGQAYSGLLRDVYDDERRAWEPKRKLFLTESLVLMIPLNNIKR